MLVNTLFFYLVFMHIVYSKKQTNKKTNDKHRVKRVTLNSGGGMKLEPYTSKSMLKSAPSKFSKDVDAAQLPAQGSKLNPFTSFFCDEHRYQVLSSDPPG